MNDIRAALTTGQIALSMALLVPWASSSAACRRSAASSWARATRVDPMAALRAE